ncbi:hypothetical protein X755_15590 [Mesorhizobium sp. LNJC405B00]|nr:hypothetical protein X755_15590 [Mesorhizobium sp. LNJC405B00]
MLNDFGSDSHRGVPMSGTSDDRLGRRRKLGRERQARHKERKELGGIILPIQVDFPLINLMLEAGAVDEAGSRNRKRIGRVIIRIAADALSSAVASGRRVPIDKE